MTKRRRWLSMNLQPLLISVVFVMLCLVMALLSEHFLTLRNLKNMVESSSFRLLLATGMTVVIASGAIDLSLGSIVSLSGIAMAALVKAGWPVAFAIGLGLLAGLLMGALNGIVIAYSRLSPFIVTLAFMSVFRGLSLILTEGIPITQLPQAFLYFGRSDVYRLNPPIVIALAVIALFAPFLYRTRPGQYLIALGGNEEALYRQGISTKRYRIAAHMILGLLAAVAGLIVTARLNAAEANAGIGMELDAITAVILGGTPLAGGHASLYGTVVAVLLLGAIRNALTILSVSPYYQQFTMGLLLLVSVLVARKRETV